MKLNFNSRKELIEHLGKVPKFKDSALVVFKPGLKIRHDGSGICYEVIKCVEKSGDLLLVLLRYNDDGSQYIQSISSKNFKDYSRV